MIKKLLCLVLIGLLISGCKSQKEEITDNPLMNEFVVETYNNEEHPDIKINQGVKDDKKVGRGCQREKHQPKNNQKKEEDNTTTKPKDTSTGYSKVSN